MLLLHALSVLLLNQLPPLSGKFLHYIGTSYYLSDLLRFLHLPILILFLRIFVSENKFDVVL